MKTKIKVLLGIVLCVVFGCMLFVGCNDKKNDNENEILEAKTIEVGTEDELFSIGQYVGEKYKNYTIKLTSDISLTKDWTPVGLSLGRAFCGTFDGNGKTISGLKITGWEDGGKPKYIAKQILGWSENGLPIYKSSEVVKFDKGNDLDNGKYAVSNIVKQGDDADESYAALSNGDGETEEETSYGSVGLFGYTKGATIKNLTINGADISYYTSGDYSYAGIVSGCAIAGSFENVTVTGGQIRTSHIYEQKISYNMDNATPKGITSIGVVREYVGGIVGYAKGSTDISDDGQAKTVATKFNDVKSENFNYGNLNYEAFYDIGLNIMKNPDGNEANNNIFYIDTNVEPGYKPQSTLDAIRYGTAALPISTYVGGVAGYASGSHVENATVDGFNKVTLKEGNEAEQNKETLIATKALYAAGIVGGFYSSEANGTLKASGVGISGTYRSDWWNDNNYIGLLKDKVTASGAFGIVQKSSVSGAKVENLYVDVSGSELENVCIGGIVGYEDDQSVVKDSSVKKAYFYSSFGQKSKGDNKSESGSEYSSIIGGAVAVVRNSIVDKVDADDVKVEIGARGEKDYSFTRGIVAQAYGNSSVVNSTAKNVYIYNQGDRSKSKEFTDVDPIIANNNYVNEDGYPSIRLYYSPDGKYDKVYVTAYAELIGRDKDGNLLVKKDVYTKTTAFDSFNEGDEIPKDMRDKYYSYSEDDKRYIFIRSNDLYEEKYGKYHKDWVYATKETAYEVVILDKNKQNALDKNLYKEYDEAKATLTPTTDEKARDGKSYYIASQDFETVVNDYVVDVKLYAENSKQFVLDPKDKNNDDDDVKAHARYAVEKTVVAERTATIGDKTVAEAFLDVYFTPGEGFETDIDGNVMKYYDASVANRNFAKYKAVYGRVTTSELKYVQE